MLNNKDIGKYFDNLEKRVLGLQNQVMGSMADSFKDDVKSNAQNQGETYQDDLMVSRIKDSESSFIVHISAQEQSLGESLNPSVFFYIPTSPYSIGSDLTAALISSQPYTKDFLPYDPVGYYKLVYRKVDAEEWQAVQDKNAAEAVSMVNKLMTAGADPTKMIQPSSQIENIPVVEDVVWRVVRQELGIREQRKQVWTPAVNDFKRKKYLKQAVKDSKLDRILIDGDWKDIFQADSEVDETYVQKFEKFQKYILGV